MNTMIFRGLNQDEGETFIKWADNFYDENIKDLLSSAQLWHPLVRDQLIQRFKDDLGDYICNATICEGRIR